MALGKADGSLSSLEHEGTSEYLTVLSPHLAGILLILNSIIFITTVIIIK